MPGIADELQQGCTAALPGIASSAELCPAEPSVPQRLCGAGMRHSEAQRWESHYHFQLGKAQLRRLSVERFMFFPSASPGCFVQGHLGKFKGNSVFKVLL